MCTSFGPFSTHTHAYMIPNRPKRVENSETIVINTKSDKLKNYFVEENFNTKYNCLKILEYEEI